MIQIILNWLQLFVKNIDLVLQLAQLRLDLNIWPCLLKSPLQLIDFVIKLLFLVLIDVSSGQLTFLLIDPVS